jgi:predicted GNAT family acetyltransferase
LDEVTAVMSEAFVTGSSVNRRVVRPAHLHEDDIVHYLIYGDGAAVGSATVALHGNGLASIWNVGTRYHYRRQRYATTLMLAVLDDLRRRGFSSSVLMASSSGLPLYEQLGYRTIGRTTFLAPPLARRSD